LAGLLAQFKSYGSSGFLLPHCCAIRCVSARGYILNPDGNNVTAAKLAVDCQIEHGKVASAAFDLELGSDRPDKRGVGARSRVRRIFRRPKRCLTGRYVSEEIAPDKRGGRMQLQLPHPLLLGHISFVTPPLAGKGSRKSRS
jgi:hypothetical protein